MKVPNKELREAFLRSNMTAHDIALFCGWVKKSGTPDTTKLMRSLGLNSHKDKSGKVRTNTNMQEKTALKIIKALNLDPVDFRDIGL